METNRGDKWCHWFVWCFSAGPGGLVDWPPITNVVVGSQTDHVFTVWFCNEIWVNIG